MKAILLIARRELAAYLRTMTGYIIIALMLALTGLFFNAYGLGGVDKRSSDALRVFFEIAQAFTAGSGVFISMRLIAEERQTGTLALLYSSPVRDGEIVVGKFLSSLAFLAIMLAGTVFMPLLIFVNGKISLGHMAAGYLGLLLLGGATLAIGTLGSALARSQVVAVIASSAMVVALYCFVYVAHVTERPLAEVCAAMAFFPHFQPFESGLVHLRDVAYFVVVTYLALFGATRVLEARRWR
jgi:ABC-2 type transport system permease protein